MLSFEFALYIRYEDTKIHMHKREKPVQLMVTRIIYSRACVHMKVKAGQKRIVYIHVCDSPEPYKNFLLTSWEVPGDYI